MEEIILFLPGRRTGFFLKKSPRDKTRPFPAFFSLSHTVPHIFSETKKVPPSQFNAIFFRINRV
jgi:hypothetical protein